MDITVVDRTADDLVIANLGFEYLSQICSADKQERPRILEPLSEVIDYGLRAHTCKESMKLLWDKYPRPENSKNMIVPRIINEFWPNLSNSVKTRDIRYQKLQSLILKTAVLAITLMDSIKRGRKLDVSFLENAMTIAKDSVMLLLHANSDLTVHR